MTYTITPLIGEKAIAARVRELAASIDADMGDRPYVLLRLLEGAVPVVDDVLDTGRTLAGVCGELKKRGVQRVLTAVAVDKHCCRKVPFEADYAAFTWGDDFLVGFGMDLDNRYRDLPYIGKAAAD